MHPPTFSMEERRVAHAAELFEALSDERLYEFLDKGPPASALELANKLARSESRLSPDGKQHWLNWVVRSQSGKICGYVQATVEETGDTNVAYVFSSDQQGKGIATAAVQSMLDLVSTQHEVSNFFILTDANNLRSVRLAQRLGFTRAPREAYVARNVGESVVLFWKRAAASEA